MRLATIGVRGPLGLISRVVAAEADPASGAAVLVDVTAAGELWWSRQGSGNPVVWAAATFPADLTALLRGGAKGLEMAAEAVALGAAQGLGAKSPSGAPLIWSEYQVERLPLLQPPLLRDFYSFEQHVVAGAARRVARERSERLARESGSPDAT